MADNEAAEATVATVETKKGAGTRADAMEIMELCTLAGADLARASAYVAGDKPLAEIRKELLAARAEAHAEELSSHVTAKTGAGQVIGMTPETNPLIAACNALVKTMKMKEAA